jgi:hypothetical protein
MIALLLLTPLLLALIVALFGFAGCASFGTGNGDTGATGTGQTPPPAAPPFDYNKIIDSTAGIAAHWPLNETGGNVAVVLGSLAPVDNGTYQGTVKLGDPGVFSAKDAKNFAPSFDGTSGRVEVPFDKRLNPAPSLEFSVELWVKPDPASPAATQVLISSHQIDATNDRGYEIALVKVAGQAHHQIRGRLYSSGASPTEVTWQPTQGDPGAWRLVVLTYKGGGGAAGKALTLFVGVAGVPGLFKSGPVTGSDYQAALANQTLLRFGAGHQAGGAPATFFKGWIDEVAFYNLALPQSDIETHFTAL